MTVLDILDGGTFRCETPACEVAGQELQEADLVRLEIFLIDNDMED